MAIASTWVGAGLLEIGESSLTGNQTLIARACLGIVAASFSVGAFSNAHLRSLPPRKFDQVITAALVVSRLAIYLLVFLVFGIPPRGDIPSYYWSEANNVLHGLLPYRDFPSSYAPLHAFLDAAIVRTWFSPLAIILFALLLECLAVPLWIYLGRKLFTDQVVRGAALLYVTSAISIQFVSIDGQDNILIAGLFALAILLLMRDRPVLSGIVVGLAAVTTKFLPLIYAPLFFVTALHRWRWAIGLMLPVTLIYGGFAAHHLPILNVLSREGDLRSANNLTYLVESISGVAFPSFFWNGVMAIAFLVIFALVARAAKNAPLSLRSRAVVFGTAALTLALLLFSKKSWPPYLVLSLFPICLLSAGSRIKSTVFALYGVIAIVNPSYWATLLRQFSAREFHEGLLAGSAHCYVFLALQLMLIAGYLWMLSASLTAITALHAREKVSPPEKLKDSFI